MKREKGTFDSSINDFLHDQTCADTNPPTYSDCDKQNLAKHLLSRIFSVFETVTRMKK